MSRFDSLGFVTDYSIQVGPEFPGSGDWGCPVVGFDHEGRPVAEFDSRSGTPLVVKIEPVAGPEWVAMFPSGGVRSLLGLFGTPAARDLVAVGDGSAYLVHTDQPGASATFLADGVHQVTTCDTPRLLLLVTFSDLVAVGATGLAWETPRLCLDELEVQGADAHGIVCTGYGPGNVTITVDPATGAVLS